MFRMFPSWFLKWFFPRSRRNVLARLVMLARICVSHFLGEGYDTLLSSLEQQKVQKTWCKHSNQASFLQTGLVHIRWAAGARSIVFVKWNLVVKGWAVGHRTYRGEWKPAHAPLDNNKSHVLQLSFWFVLTCDNFFHCQHDIQRHIVYSFKMVVIGGSS